ncbi:MAG TPA: ParA family protein [Allocoleopsis sp.]
MGKPIVVWIGANAGGVGKTTLVVHLGYELAKRGYNVLVIDLDTNVSMAQFCGLPTAIPPDHSTVSIFSDSFKGKYPFLTPAWGTPKGRLDVCLGGTIMVKAELDLASRSRREYVIADAFQDYPPPYDLIMLDCPASLGPLSDVALAAATHVLIPSEVSPKALTGANALLDWMRGSIRRMRLSPPPNVLGFVPTQYKNDEAQQRGLAQTLPEALKQQKIGCYRPIRYTAEFKNASREGVPLQKYRPGHPACKELKPIADDLEKLIREQ